MQYANLGNTSTKFSKILLGTWQTGKSMWSDIDDSETTKAIRGALDCGITTVDTAIIYGNGYAETMIAKALKEVSRDKYQLADKVFSNKLKYPQVLEECDKTLQNLQTDYLDLYQIHWPAGSFDSEVVSIEETMKALNELQKSGKIKHIGVSNFSKEQIIEASLYGTIVSNQPPYSLVWRQYDQGTNQYCRENNISILSYSPLAQGLLTGKFKKDHKFAASDHRSANKLFSPKIFDKVLEVTDGLKQYAERYNTTISNIALNWVISQPNTFAIAGARNLTQVQENAKACDFQLTPEELTEIDRLSKLVTDNMQQTGMMWSW